MADTFPASSPNVSFREVATDAIHYWEPRRLLYNAVLALEVIEFFYVALPDSRALLTLNSLLGLFVLAVLANLCYCAVYLVDLFAQFSGLQPRWLRWRWLLLALGVAFAGTITYFLCLAFFAPTH